MLCYHLPSFEKTSSKRMEPKRGDEEKRPKGEKGYKEENY